MGGATNKKGNWERPIINSRDNDGETTEKTALAKMCGGEPAPTYSTKKKEVIRGNKRCHRGGKNWSSKKGNSKQGDYYHKQGGRTKKKQWLKKRQASIL